MRALLIALAAAILVTPSFDAQSPEIEAIVDKAADYVVDYTRDFVGIAENQWDFNGKGAIAGFGSLSAEETARYVAARALGAEHGEGTQADQGEYAEVSASNASKDSAVLPSTTNSAPPSRPLAQASLVPPPAASTTAATAPQSSNAPPGKRTHGSALPK